MVGAALDARDPRGRTALAIATANRDAPCVRALGAVPSWNDEEEGGGGGGAEGDDEGEGAGDAAAGGAAVSGVRGLPGAVDGVAQGPPPGWRNYSTAAAAAARGPITPHYARSLDVFGI